MKTAVWLALALALAGCGAGGPPRSPTGMNLNSVWSGS